MNKIFMSFGSICHALNESRISLDDIRKSSLLVFACAREYWDGDNGVPRDFLTSRENRIVYSHREGWETWVPENTLPDSVVRRWKGFRAVLQAKDSMPKESPFFENILHLREELPKFPPMEGYYDWAEWFSSVAKVFVFMGSRLYVPHLRDFAVEHNDVSDTFLHIIRDLSSDELCVLIEQHPEHWKQYESFVAYLPFWRNNT